MTKLKPGRPRRDRSSWDEEAYEAARVKRRLTYRQIAEAVGVSTTTAHRWRDGMPPASDLVPAIAKALGVPQKTLMRRKA